MFLDKHSDADKQKTHDLFASSVVAMWFIVSDEEKPVFGYVKLKIGLLILREFQVLIAIVM